MAHDGGIMFLTPEEIRMATGKIMHSAQIAALRRMGIVCKVRPDGSPLVLKAHAEEELGKRNAVVTAKIEFEPDFSHVH